MEDTEFTANKNPSTFSYAIKWVLILSFIQIIFSVIMYLTNQLQEGGGWLAWVSYIFIFGIPFLAVRNFRDKELGGYITLGKGFGLAFQIIFFAGIINAIYSFIFFSYISPETITQMAQIAEQKMTEKGGMTDEQIDTAMKYTKMFMKPGIIAGFAVVGAAFMGAILALIIAAINKKDSNTLLPPQ